VPQEPKLPSLDLIKEKAATGVFNFRATKCRDWAINAYPRAAIVNSDWVATKPARGYALIANLGILWREN